MLQYLFLHTVRYGLIWIFSHKIFISLTEDIEESLIPRRAAIERTLNRNPVFIIIFLIVGKYHQLGDIQESSEFFVAHPHIDTLPFCQNAVMVIRLLDLNKS